MTAEAYPSVAEPRIIGRYILHGELASGGMARVCLGKLRTEGGFARVVAIKTLFPQYARDPEFVKMFLDEARVAARVRHPNVVGTLDVVADDGELFLVMEYVAGETLARLLSGVNKRSEPVEPAIASAIVSGFLEGLHAAHTATDASGAPLNIVHRDVSPQNVLIGVDGVPRVVDFGVAKAMGRLQTTDDGQLKGKLLYMPPEQMRPGGIDRRADLWAAGAVLWEMLAGRRPFNEMPEALAYHAGKREIEAPGVVAKRETPLDAVVLRAMSRDPDERFPTAREMIVAIEKAVPPAPARRVAQWVARIAEEALARRQALVSAVEAYEPRAETATTSTPTVVPAYATAPESRTRRGIAIVGAAIVAGIAAGTIFLAASKPRSERANAVGTAASAVTPTVTEAPPPPQTNEPASAPVVQVSAPPTSKAPPKIGALRGGPATKKSSAAKPEGPPPPAPAGGDPLELDKRK